GVEDGDPLDVAPGLPGRDPGHDTRAVRAVPKGVERALVSRDALHDQLRAGIDEDAHAAFPPVASSAARRAASSMVAADTIRSWFASARILLPSSALVPSSRTTIGTLPSTRCRAFTIPRATTSQRVNP